MGLSLHSSALWPFCSQRPLSEYAASPWLLGLSGVLATLGLLLTLNGYLLLVPLPHGDAAHDAHPPPATAAGQPAH